MATMNFMERFKNKISTLGRFGELELDNNKAVSKPSSCLQTKTNLKLVANSILSPPHIEDEKLNLPEENPFQFVRPIKVSIIPNEGGSIVNNLDIDLRSIRAENRIISVHGLDRYNYQTSYSPPNISKVDKFHSNLQSCRAKLKPRTVSPPISHILSSPLGNKPCTTDQASLQPTPNNSKHTRTEFKPYTIKDYTRIKFVKYYELGGLGPVSIGTEEWKRRKEQQDRRKMYANRVKVTNFSALSGSPRPIQRKSEKMPSVRQRGIEFAKKVPLPRFKAMSDDLHIERGESEITDLLRMEIEHDKMKNSVVKLKSYLE